MKISFSNCRSKRHRCRNAFTLIEMIVIITMLTSLIALTGTTFSLLMRSEKLVTQSLITERITARLAEHFRNDVHESKIGTLVESTTTTGQELLLGDDGGTRIRYLITKEGIARFTVHQGKIVARDDFRLPDCHSTFAKGPESDSLLRSLTIKRSGPIMTRHAHAPKTLRALEIEAFLDRRSRPLLSTADRDSQATTEATEARQ